MPIAKGGKPIDPGPIKPPQPVAEGNCFTCGKFGRPECPMPQEVGRRILQDSAAFRSAPLADMPCAGDEHDATPVSASMRIAVAQAKVRSVRQFGTERVIEAVAETVEE